MAGQRVRFGSFLLDEDRKILFERDTAVDLGGKAIALLQALVTARGQAVSKADLLNAAWPNASVEESNLTVQIAQLRKRLGASAESESWIATVPRVGYRFVGALDADTAPQTRSGSPSASAPETVTLAVLPFTNMSSDPEQEFFADGLAEDLISDLSKVPGLVVIARNSSFTYKGKAVDLRAVAADLGVRYVVEGSVRRAATRIRISAQLIDIASQVHLWVDRFDRDLADVFVLQDEIVGRIVTALTGALPSDAVASRRSSNLEAYDLFVRGRVLSTQTPEANKAARPLLEKAIALDPAFAEAYGWLALSHAFGWAHWGEDSNHQIQALALARQAVQLDTRSAAAHTALGYVLMVDSKPEEASTELNTALRINPNHADAWCFLGTAMVFEGSAADGIEEISKAFRLNPHPAGWYYWLLGFAQYAARRYDDAVLTLRHASTHRTVSQRILAASLALSGLQAEADKEARQFLAMVPNFSIEHWARIQPFRHEEDRRHFVEGYRKAGLPN